MTQTHRHTVTEVVVTQPVQASATHPSPTLCPPHKYCLLSSYTWRRHRAWEAQGGQARLAPDILLVLLFCSYDLSGLDHTGLDHRSLDHTDLDHTDIDHTDIDHTDLDHTDLDHTDIDHTDLNHTDIDHTDIDHTDLDHTDLDHTYIDHTSQDHTDQPVDNQVSCHPDG